MSRVDDVSNKHRHGYNCSPCSSLCQLSCDASPAYISFRNKRRVKRPTKSCKRSWEWYMKPWKVWTICKPTRGDDGAARTRTGDASPYTDWAETRTDEATVTEAPGLSASRTEGAGFELGTEKTWQIHWQQGYIPAANQMIASAGGFPPLKLRGGSPDSSSHLTRTTPEWIPWMNSYSFSCLPI